MKRLLAECPPRLVVPLLGVFLALASSLEAQAPRPTSGRAVHVRIETDRQSYRANEKVRLRLTLHSLSSHTIQYINNPPAHLIRLRLLDSEGHEVKHGLAGANQELPMRPRHVSLKPGEEQVLRWKGSEWLDLQDWSYHLRSGRYTLVGIPMVAGKTLKPDQVTVRSNEVTFTIEP